MGHFVVLGQFVAPKMAVKQRFFMSASVGHFVAGEEMGHFAADTICHVGRKWDILSSGTICHPKNAVGTIYCWDKMSPNLLCGRGGEILLTNPCYRFFYKGL